MAAGESAPLEQMRLNVRSQWESLPWASNGEADEDDSAAEEEESMRRSNEKSWCGLRSPVKDTQLKGTDGPGLKGQDHLRHQDKDAWTSSYCSHFSLLTTSLLLYDYLNLLTNYTAILLPQNLKYRILRPYPVLPPLLNGGRGSPA